MPVPGPRALVRLLPAAVFVGIPCILILPILFSGKLIYGHDLMGVFYYSRSVIADAFRSGRLPVWDPHVMAGFPLLAAVQGAVFYPPSWLCIVLPSGVFWTSSVLIHMILSGGFAWAWLRRGLRVGAWAALLGGFVFMMSGYFVTRVFAGHVNYVWAYPWMAALLWRLERFLAGPTLKRGVLLGVVLALLFLAGVPQFVLFAGLLCAGRLAQHVLGEREGRRDRLKVAGRCAAWLLLGLLVCAPQLFPTLELIGQMQRGAAPDGKFTMDNSMPLGGLAWLALFPDHRAPFLWEVCGFVGAAVLLAGLAFAGRHPQRFLWGGLALAALLLALGDNAPFYRAFVALLPGSGAFRAPGRFLLLFVLSATALSAIGFDALWGRGRAALRIPTVVIALVTAVQLFVFGHRFFIGVEEGPLRWPPAFEALLRERVGLESRVASGRSMRIDAIGRCQAAGIDQVCGYEPMMLRRFAELINAARGAPPGENITALASVGGHPLVDMLGARWWLTAGDPKGLPVVVERRDALPRAWVVNHAMVLESAEERLKTLAGGSFDPARTVILEQFPPEAPPQPSASPGRAKLLSRGPGDYLLEAENGADAYLVLSEAWYPGWRVEVDGKPADLLPANHLIQAVRLQPGRHVVRFTYRSRFLPLGFAVAALAILGPAAVVLVRRRRRELPL